MHGFIEHHRIRQQSRHHKRHHAATTRAFAGARLLLGLPVSAKTQREAAKLVASTPRYIMAAITLIQSEDWNLIEHALNGNVSLLAAAAGVRKRADLITAYRRASSADRAALGPTVGIDRVFDEAIAPSL